VKLVRLDRDRALDYDSEGRLISRELRNVSRGVVLDGLPERGLVRTSLDLVGPGTARRRA
jgi:hypothetical protein